MRRIEEGAISMRFGRSQLSFWGRCKVPIGGNHRQSPPPPTRANSIQLASRPARSSRALFSYLGCPPARQLTITFVFRIALLLFGGSMKYGATASV